MKIFSVGNIIRHKNNGSTGVITETGDIELEDGNIKTGYFIIYFYFDAFQSNYVKSTVYALSFDQWEIIGNQSIDFMPREPQP